MSNNKVVFHLNNAMFALANARRMCEQDTANRIEDLVNEVQSLSTEVYNGPVMAGQFLDPPETFYPMDGDDPDGGVKVGEVVVMPAAGGTGRSMLDETKSMAQDIKTLAMETGKAFITATQISEAAYKETNKIIYLESGTLESGEDVGSIEPASFIGKSNLLVFNIKTRALSIYVEQNVSGLHMVGTTIKNFDPELSYSKTLRKPNDQIPMFLDDSNPKYQIHKIKGAAKPQTGRINGHCILLRAW